jgi:hypothetical protein
VSKPKRNPASAEVSDQKKMRPFIEDEVEIASHDKGIGDDMQTDATLSSGVV